MKIAVIGSHCTGKSTICIQLAKHFRFKFIPDVTTKAFHLKFTLNETTPPETQFWILSKQLELERNTPTPWIMEKSLWDNIIYGNFAIKDEIVNKVINEIVERNADYDLVFYCSVEFPIVGDGIRSLDENFRKTIDKDFRKYIKRNGIPIHELKGNQTQRFKQAELIIKKYRLKNK